MTSKIAKIKHSVVSFFNSPMLKNADNPISIRPDKTTQANPQNHPPKSFDIDETYLYKFSNSVLVSMLKELQRENNQWNSQATREQRGQDPGDNLKGIDLSTLSHSELVKALATALVSKMAGENNTELKTSTCRAIA